MNDSRILSAADAERIIAVLLEHQVEFVICGGAACILHGVEGRVTGDLDLRVNLESENLRRLVAAIKAMRFQARIPEPLEAIADPDRRRVWIDEKQAVVSTYTSPDFAVQLDVFLEYPISYADLAARADRMSHSGATILVSSKQDLIRAKQAVKPPRKIDQRDIADLEELIAREHKP